MAQKKLPVELGLKVIEALGDGHDLYRVWDSWVYEALCSCALVCKDWHRPSRIQLYRVIHVGSRIDLDSLRLAFAHHPELQACAKALHIHGVDVVNIAIISLVPPLPNIHVLGLWWPGCSDEKPHLTHRALTALKVSPKLTTLCTDYLGSMHEESFLQVTASLPSLSNLVCGNFGYTTKTEIGSHSLRQTYADILSRRRSVRSMTFHDRQNRDALLRISHVFYMSLEKITLIAFSPVFNFSDFPNLKDVTASGAEGPLEHFACSESIGLLKENLYPGPILKKITLTISSNIYRGEEEESVKELQELILSEQYKSVQWELKLIHVKINLLIDTEKHLRQAFPHVLGDNSEHRVQLSLTESGFGHQTTPAVVVTSPNGMFTASISKYNDPMPVAVIWNARTGQILSQWSWTPQAPLLGGNHPVFIVFSPDSTIVLFLNYLLNKLQIRSTATGDLLQTFKDIRGILVPYDSFNNRSFNGAILLWEASTITIYDSFQKGIHIYHIDDVPRPIRRGFICHHSIVYPAATLSRSGRWLCVVDKEYPTGYVADTISPDIHMVLSSVLQVWHLSTYSYRKYLAAAFDEAEETLIVVTGTGQVLRWCIPRKCFLGTVDIIGADGKWHNLSHACLSGDGSRIAWVPADGHADGAVLCGRLTGGEFVVLQYDRKIKCISLSQDGQYVAIFSRRWNSGPLSVFRTRDGKRVFQDQRDIGEPCVSFGGCRMGEVTLSYRKKDGTVRIVRMCDVDVED